MTLSERNVFSSRTGEGGGCGKLDDMTGMHMNDDDTTGQIRNSGYGPSFYGCAVVAPRDATLTYAYVSVASLGASADCSDRVRGSASGPWAIISDNMFFDLNRSY